MTGPVLVQLVNGVFVQSDAESWRHQCEASYVANLPHENRERYLVHILAKRGQSEHDRIVQTMRELREKGAA